MNKQSHFTTAYGVLSEFPPPKNTSEDLDFTIYI